MSPRRRSGPVASIAVSSLLSLETVARGGAPPPLEPDERASIERGRSTVERLVASGEAVYGLTTGFGSLASVRIDPADARALQRNLIRSHAVGAGDPLPPEIVRGMLFLLAASLRRGNSGVRPELVDLLLSLLQRDVVPVVPSRGSVGSSGDLAPLAHLALVLIGEGEAFWRGRAHAGRRCPPARWTGARRARREGGPRAHQRHAPDGLVRRSRAARGAPGARGRDRRLRALARGLHGLDGAVRRSHPRASAPARAATCRDTAARAARRQPDRGEPRGLRPRAGSVHPPLHPPGARRGVRRPRLRRGNAGARADGRHRQPARLPGRGRRRVGRQLPRAAAVAGARPSRACPVRARLVLGAAHVRAALAVLRGAAALPDPPSRPQLRPHDRAVRAGGARLGVHGAVAPGRGRVDSDVGGPGGLQLDGRARGPEGANGRRARLARRRLRARLRLSGPRVPPPAPHHRAARGGARARCGERIPRMEHDRSLSDELAALARDIRLGELALP